MRVRLGIQGRWIHVPHTAKRRKTSASAPQSSGLSFLARLALKICLKICVEAEGAGGQVIKKHNSAFVKVQYWYGDRGTGEVPMFAHIRAEILFLAAGTILVVGVAYLF